MSQCAYHWRKLRVHPMLVWCLRVQYLSRSPQQVLVWPFCCFMLELCALHEAPHLRMLRCHVVTASLVE